MVLGGLIVLLTVVLMLFGQGPPPPARAEGGPGLRAAFLTQFTPSSSPVRGLAFGADGRLLIASADGTLTSRSMEGAIRRFRAGPPIAFMRISPDRRSLALGGYDGSVTLIATDGRTIRKLAKSGAATWSLAFAPSGEQLAAGSEDGRLRLFDLTNASQRTVKAHRLNIWSLDVNRRTGQLASGSFDRRIRLWDMATAKPMAPTAAHDQAVVALAFAPRGDRLASGGDDATLRLWDSGLRPVWRREAGHHVYDLLFTPDSRWIATGGRESSGLQSLFRQLFGIRLGGGHGTTVRLWRAQDGAMVDEVGMQPSDVFGLALSEDGKILATGADNGSVALWRLDGTALR